MTKLDGRRYFAISELEFGGGNAIGSRSNSRR